MKIACPLLTAGVAISTHDTKTPISTNSRSTKPFPKCKNYNLCEYQRKTHLFMEKRRVDVIQYLQS